MLHEPTLSFSTSPPRASIRSARRQLWDLLFELSGSWHHLLRHHSLHDEAERCSHVAYIYYGKLIADGTPIRFGELPDVQPPGTLAR